MDIRHNALILVSGGVLLVPLGFYLPGNAQAPLSLGGIPRPFYTGIAAGYIVGGGIAYVVGGSERTPKFKHVLRATLLTIPLAFVLSVVLTYLDVGAVSNVQRFLALHLGIAFLFYPLAFGLVFGFGTEARDQAMVWVIVLVSLVVVVLSAFFAPRGGIGAAFVFLGLFAIFLVDLIFAYPLYRIGLRLGPESTPP